MKKVTWQAILKFITFPKMNCFLRAKHHQTLVMCTWIRQQSNITPFFALPGTTSHRESFYGTESSTRSEKFPVQWGDGELNRGGGSRQSKKLSMRNIDKPSTVGRNGCLSSLSLILSLQKFFLNDRPIAWPCCSLELGGVLELWGPLFHFGSKLIRMN